jgi:hypothetical protein
MSMLPSIQQQQQQHVAAQQQLLSNMQAAATATSYNSAPLSVLAFSSLRSPWPQSSFVNLNLLQHYLQQQQQQQQQQTAAVAAQQQQIQHQLQLQQLVQHQQQQYSSASIPPFTVFQSLSPPAPSASLAHSSLGSTAAPLPVQTTSQPLPTFASASDTKRKRRGDDERRSRKRSKGNKHVLSVPATENSAAGGTSPSSLHSALSQPAALSIFATASQPPFVSVSALPKPLPLTASQTATRLLSLSNLCHAASSLTSPPILNSSAARSSSNTSASSISLPGSLGHNHLSSSGFASVLDADSIRCTSSNEFGSDSDSMTVSKRKTRKKKHLVTDRQRRAKIKKSMNQLRALVHKHGSFTTDHVSIMMASVQLILQLIEERRSAEREKTVIAAELEQMKQSTSIIARQHQQQQQQSLQSAVPSPLPPPQCPSPLRLFPTSRPPLSCRKLRETVHAVSS